MENLQLLVLGDVHASLDALSLILASVENSGESYDAVVCTGDLGSEILGSRLREQRDQRRRLYAASVTAVFESLGTLGIPVLYVPGNHDERSLKSAKNIINVDVLNGGSPYEIGGWIFWGVGGCPRTPAEWCYEWDDGGIYSLLAERDLPRGNRVVLISHSPPFAARCDVSGWGEHLGSQDVKRLVEDRSPRIVVCGHIHEATCCEVIGQSFVLNAGAIQDIRHLYMPLRDGHRSQRPVPHLVYSYFGLLISNTGITAVNYMLSPPPPAPIIVEPTVWHYDGKEVDLVKAARNIGRKAWDV